MTSAGFEPAPGDVGFGRDPAGQSRLDVVHVIEAHAGRQAVRRDRPRDETDAKPALSRRRDDSRAGAMDAAGSTPAERGPGERAARDLRPAECQTVGEGRLEVDAPTAQPGAPVRPGADEAGPGRPGIERGECGARLVDDRSSAEVHPGSTAQAPGGPEVGVEDHVDRAPWTGGRGRGGDVGDETAPGHEGAKLPRVQHQPETRAHLAGREQLTVGVESRALGGEAEVAHPDLASGLGDDASGGAGRRHCHAARREAEVADGQLGAATADGRRGRELECRHGDAARRRCVELRHRHPTVAHFQALHLERRSGRAAAGGEPRQPPAAVLPHEPDARGYQREAVEEHAAAEQRERRVDDLRARHAQHGVAGHGHVEVAEHERPAEGSAHAAEFDLGVDAATERREHPDADHLLNDAESARDPERQDENGRQRREDGEHAAEESRHQNFEPRLTCTCQPASPSGGWNGNPRSARSGPTGDL